MSGRGRVLMTADAVGGVWQYATELAAALVPIGYETVLALVGPPPTPAERQGIGRIAGVQLIETGLPLDWLSPDVDAVAATGRAIAALAQAERVDLVHLNQPALAGAAEFAMPLVVAVHSCVATWWAAVHGAEPEPEHLAWQSSLVREGLHRAAAVVAPSGAFATAVQLRYRLRASPELVYNGRSPLPALPHPPRDFAFTAGRLWDRGKNCATLDRAAARLTVPVEAAGPLAGPQGERIGFAHMRALGRLDAAGLADRFSARPVFVSAARYEPFGLAVLEAALAGCSLVLSDIPTFRELWGDAASFVAPDDAEGFAAAIAALLRDPQERLRRGERARRCAQQFTPGRMAGGMATIYARLLGADARAAA